MTRYFMFFMALAASVLSVRAGAQTAIAGAENRRIEALQQTIASAIIRRDISVLDSLYADDYEYVDTAGVVYTKAQVLARYRTPTIENTSLTYDSLRVRIYGDVAVVIGRAHVLGRERGAPFDRYSHFARVHVKRGGIWQVAAYQIIGGPSRPSAR